VKKTTRKAHQTAYFRPIKAYTRGREQISINGGEWHTSKPPVEKYLSNRLFLQKGEETAKKQGREDG